MVLVQYVNGPLHDVFPLIESEIFAIGGQKWQSVTLLFTYANLKLCRRLSTVPLSPNVGQHALYW